MKPDSCDLGLEDDLSCLEPEFSELVRAMSHALEDNPTALEKALDVIFSFAGHRMYFSRRPIRLHLRVRATKKLLQAGVNRKEIVQILIERFGITRPTAYKTRNFAEGEWARERSRNVQRIATKFSGQAATSA